jgi:hypothetical protein
MNFNSFILHRSSFIGLNVSDLVGEKGIPLEMKGKSGDASRSFIPKDDSFFRTDDPEVDPVQALDVLRVIPFGRFHYLMIFLYFTLFISTSFLAYNFAFFLMP